MTQIRLENVSKIFSNNKYPTLDQINLTIEDGEFVTIVGPKESGKTTLFEIIAGITKPSVGKVIFDEINVTQLPPAERNLAMSFQNRALYPHRTVYENLAFELQYQNIEKDLINYQVQQVADQVGISHLLNRKIVNLSINDRHLVAFAKSLVKKADIYLFDQPFSDFPKNLRYEMRQILVDIHRQTGATVIYCTGNTTEALAFPDRLMILKEGQITQFDSPENIYHQPKNVEIADYVSNFQVNKFEAKVEENKLVLSDGLSIPIPVHLRDILVSGGYIGQDILIGVRPEDIHTENIFIQTFPEYTFEAKVTNVEFVGPLKQISFRTKKDLRLTALVHKRELLEIGQKVLLAFDQQRLLLFDKDSKQRI